MKLRFKSTMLTHVKRVRKEEKMIQTDLITGFLGSGKTTFIKKYARYLIGRGMSIGILENDYGAINVDLMLLQDLPEENCEVEMVIGGDYDCHRRRFKTKLIAMGMTGYDRVLIEPSGIYDVDEFFDVLNEEPLERWYRPGNVIAVVDAAVCREELSEEAEYLLMTQVANAGIVIFSKVQEASEQEIEKSRNLINHVMEKFGCARRFSDEFLICDWENLTQQDFDRIISAGYVPEDHVKEMIDRDNAFTTLFYMNEKMNRETLSKTVSRLFNDPSLGHVIRVKGFVRLSDGTWLSVNATSDQREIRPVEKGQEVLIVIGENLDKEKVDRCFER